MKLATDGPEHSGLPCPDCGAKLAQHKTRRIGDCIRRVRKCKACESRFVTREVISGRIRPLPVETSEN